MVLLASPLLALGVLELSLRAVHDLGGGLAGWLYISRTLERLGCGRWIAAEAPLLPAHF
jgi:hypothetical protein